MLKTIQHKREITVSKIDKLDDEISSLESQLERLNMARENQAKYNNLLQFIELSHDASIGVAFQESLIDPDDLKEFEDDVFGYYFIPCVYDCVLIADHNFKPTNADDDCQTDWEIDNDHSKGLNFQYTDKKYDGLFDDIGIDAFFDVSEAEKTLFLANDLSSFVDKIESEMTDSNWNIYEWRAYIAIPCYYVLSKEKAERFSDESKNETIDDWKLRLRMFIDAKSTNKILNDIVPSIQILSDNICIDGTSEIPLNDILDLINEKYNIYRGTTDNTNFFSTEKYEDGKFISMGKRNFQCEKMFRSQDRRRIVFHGPTENQQLWYFLKLK